MLALVLLLLGTAVLPLVTGKFNLFIQFNLLNL